MSFASTLRQSQFSLLQYLFQDLNQALCFCLRHIITSPFKFTIQRYFCPYFQHPHPGILRKFAREGAAVSSRYSPRIRSPLGSRRNAAGSARRLCRSQAGGGALAAAHWRRCASAGAGQQGRGGCPLPGRSGRRRRKMAAPSAACVGFQATSAIETAGGRKSPFLPYKEALFSGRSSCQIRAVLRPNPCRFGRVAFSAAQSDECVTPGGAGEKPRRKTKRPSERSEPHEKPDFRYRD